MYSKVTEGRTAHVSPTAAAMKDVADEGIKQEARDVLGRGQSPPPSFSMRRPRSVAE